MFWHLVTNDGYVRLKTTKATAVHMFMGVKYKRIFGIILCIIKYNRRTKLNKEKGEINKKLYHVLS